MALLTTPLPELLRPKKLEDFVGQEHLVGENSPIKKLLQNNSIHSMIFWGPPGVGKTTLARIIANELNATFIEISPTTAGVKDIKQAVEVSKKDFFGEKKQTILFVDEIHRFSKSQQDYLLPHVEKGSLVLIGATTENPSFELNAPLLSRAKVYKFVPITSEQMLNTLEKTLIYLKQNSIELKLTDEAKNFLVNLSNGDIRNLLNSIDSLIRTNIQNADVEDVKKILQEKPLRYDQQGEEHYDTISAYIKSMRASDANAALYYLARMVEGGEDPLFIARRMVIFASEDIGLADSNALVVANSVFRACEIIGYPECQINLAHGTVYMAQASKNRKACDSYFEALDDAKNLGNLEIPLKVRNAPTKLMKDLGYGKDYEKYPENESYLPEQIKHKKYL
ncbi:MAG TPA: replication-associated recombination protein A [Candidatus Saccharimonadales bacterium]|nr:replication-associated recombination protein A [Candidatus Saccharimonadales bacterium]